LIIAIIILITIIVIIITIIIGRIPYLYLQQLKVFSLLGMIRKHERVPHVSQSPKLNCIFCINFPLFKLDINKTRFVVM
jgi:hypothetical protein